MPSPEKPLKVAVAAAAARLLQHAGWNSERQIMDYMALKRPKRFGGHWDPAAHALQATPLFRFKP